MSIQPPEPVRVAMMLAAGPFPKCDEDRLQRHGQDIRDVGQRAVRLAEEVARDTDALITAAQYSGLSERAFREKAREATLLAEEISGDCAGIYRLCHDARLELQYFKLSAIWTTLAFLLTGAVSAILTRKLPLSWVRSRLFLLLAGLLEAISALFVDLGIQEYQRKHEGREGHDVARTVGTAAGALAGAVVGGFVGNWLTSRFALSANNRVQRWKAVGNVAVAGVLAGLAGNVAGNIGGTVAAGMATPDPSDGELDWSSLATAIPQVAAGALFEGALTAGRAHRLGSPGNAHLAEAMEHRASDTDPWWDKVPELEKSDRNMLACLMRESHVQGDESQNPATFSHDGLEDFRQQVHREFTTLADRKFDDVQRFLKGDPVWQQIQREILPDQQKALFHEQFRDNLLPSLEERYRGHIRSYADDLLHRHRLAELEAALHDTRKQPATLNAKQQFDNMDRPQQRLILHAVAEHAQVTTGKVSPEYFARVMDVAHPGNSPGTAPPLTNAAMAADLRAMYTPEIPLPKRFDECLTYFEKNGGKNFTELWNFAQKFRFALRENPSRLDRMILQAYRDAHPEQGEYSIKCELKGHTHWGAHGAAGPFFFHHDPTSGEVSVLLQFRAPATQWGETWSTFGGARGPKEHDITASLRETGEECDLPTQEATIYSITVDDHKNWQYATPYAHFPHKPTPNGTEETAGADWHSLRTIEEKLLHPAFRKNLTQYRREIYRILRNGIEVPDSDGNPRTVQLEHKDALEAIGLAERDAAALKDNYELPHNLLLGFHKHAQDTEQEFVYTGAQRPGEKPAEQATANPAEAVFRALTAGMDDPPPVHLRSDGMLHIPERSLQQLDDARGVVSVAPTRAPEEGSTSDQEFTLAVTAADLRQLLASQKSPREAVSATPS